VERAFGIYGIDDKFMFSFGEKARRKETTGKTSTWMGRLK
jgi:hypothetical protein